MKIPAITLLLISFMAANAQLTQHNMAQLLNLPRNVAATMIKRITYIDRLTIYHYALYHPILSHMFLKNRGYKLNVKVGFPPQDTQNIS